MKGTMLLKLAAVGLIAMLMPRSTAKRAVIRPQAIDDDAQDQHQNRNQNQAQDQDGRRRQATKNPEKR